MKIILKNYYKIMNIRILSLVMLMLIAVIVQGQDNPRREKMKEKVEAQKIAFITKALDFDADEAQKFWPIYNEYQSALEQLRTDVRKVKPSRDMTEEEAALLVTQSLEFEEKELELRKEYIAKMNEVISMKKIARLQMIEREFKRKILDGIKRRYKDRPGRKERMERRN